MLQEVLDCWVLLNIDVTRRLGLCWKLEGTDFDDPFAIEVKWRFAAGDDDADSGALFEKPLHKRGGVEKLLEVVKDDDALVIGKPANEISLAVARFVERSNGTKSVDLKGRFQSATVVTRNADGTISEKCVQNEAAAKAAIENRKATRSTAEVK